MPPNPTQAIDRLDLASKFRLRQLFKSTRGDYYPVVNDRMVALSEEFPFTVELFRRLNALPFLDKWLDKIGVLLPDYSRGESFGYKALKALSSDPIEYMPPPDPLSMGYVYNKELKRRMSQSPKEREALRQQRFLSALKNLPGHPEEMDLPRDFWKGIGGWESFEPGYGRFSPITIEDVRNAIKMPTAFEVEQEARKTNRYGGNEPLRRFIKQYHPRNWHFPDIDSPRSFHATTRKLIKSLTTGAYNPLNPRDIRHLGIPFSDMAGYWATLPHFYMGASALAKALRRSFSLEENRLREKIPGPPPTPLPPVPNDYRQFFPSNQPSYRRKLMRQRYLNSILKPKMPPPTLFDPFSSAIKLFPMGDQIENVYNDVGGSRAQDVYINIGDEVFNTPQRNSSFIDANSNLRGLMRDIRGRTIKSRSQLEDLLLRYGRKGLPRGPLNSKLITGKKMSLPLLASLNEPAYHILSAVDKLKGFWNKMKAQQAKTPTYATKKRPGT